MSDMIDRQQAIDALEKVAELFPYRVPGNRDTYDRYNEAWNDAIGRAEIEIEELSSAELERWDTCFGCPLSHGCPVIKGCTNDQAEQYAGEIPTDCPLNKKSAQPGIIRCRNCKFASGDSRICMKFGHSPIGELDFCSFAERREVTT